MIRITLALALSAGTVQAAAADAAGRAPAPSHRAGGPVSGRQQERPPQRGQSVIVRVSRGGFHWGDAAIGAAGAVGLILVTRGLALGARATRDRGARKEGGGNEAQPHA